MGIEVEFNPDLALRDYYEYERGNRRKEECIPKNLEAGKVYEFLKKGQRLFWLTDNEEWNKGEMPLVKTQGNQKFSRSIAGIKILEATHFLMNKEIYTREKYKVIEIFNSNNSKINFESYKRIK